MTNMNKNNNVRKISVPPGIRYIGKWDGFYDKFPRFPHIMDKQIPGCGFTEWCLTNKDNVILCSPRNMLILNKWEQHINEVFRVHNDSRDIDPAIDKEIGLAKIEPIETETEIAEKEAKEEGLTVEAYLKKIKEQQEKDDKTFIERLKRDLSTYFSSMDSQGKPYKILVTYDSFRVLKEIVEYFGIFDSFQIIVDEFQSIFIDSRFKSTTEMEFVNTLQGIQKVCYLSATPMISSYMKKIPEFSQLPYYEVDWESEDPTRVMRPNLKVRVIDSIYAPIKRIIDEYRTGNFEVYSELNKETGEIKRIESREAMIYVNSVKNITTLIKKNDLKPDEVNILCSNTPDNLKKIRKALGKDWTIGKVPLRNEPRKMFTICTRTVYLGADFYSDNARSFIFSDANVDCLAVDISLDLPQILGRQRLESNPWKNAAEFYYKPIKKDKEKMTKEMFEERIREKEKLSKDLLEDWQASKNRGSLARILEDRARERNYKDDYIAINTHAGNRKIPVMNHLVMIAEQRAFDIQQTDYADRFTVFNTIERTFGQTNPETAMEIKEALTEIQSRTTLVDKLKWLCEADLSVMAREVVENQMDSRIRGYLTIGRDRLKAIGYNVTRLEEIFNGGETPDNLADEVYNEFNEGDRLTKAEIKERLGKLYERVDYDSVAKASDLGEWFELKTILLTIKGKKVAGFELMKKK